MSKKKQNKKPLSIRLDPKAIKFFEKYGRGSLIAGIRRAAKVLYSLQQEAVLMPNNPMAEALDRAEKLADL